MVVINIKECGSTYGSADVMYDNVAIIRGAEGIP